MMPLFANPAGWWALLGVPLVVAIHFLQQRAKVAVTSTWFLIERLAPDSARGRTWDQLLFSRQLWLQLLAVIVAAWVLAAPRWVRAESAQTIVVVLDASASMEAFRPAAVTAAEREMDAAQGLAARTTWVVLTSDPRSPPLYRGPERLAASVALARWRPELGAHDAGEALRLANSLAGAAGRTLFITDSRAKAPKGQRTAGVGRVIENAGFAGADVTRDGARHRWRAIIRNHAATAQSRTWHAEWTGGTTAEQPLALAPGALAELAGEFPAGVDAMTIVLSADGFAGDDRLPLVRPAPKPLSVLAEGSDAAADFFRKITAEVDGVTLAATRAPARLRLAQLTPDSLAREQRGGIFWPHGDERRDQTLATEPITPTRDPLVADLNWQGWIGTGPHGFTPAPGDTMLLWQGGATLMFVRSTPGARQLVLAADWAMSNAARLPAMVLLARRFLEAERDAQDAPFAANFDCAAPLELVGGAAGAVVEFPGVKEATPWMGHVPGRAGFFNVKRGDAVVVRAAAQFADPRTADFRAAETFFNELPGERARAIEQNTRPDPFATWWLLALASLVLGSWWTRGGGAAR